MAYFAVRGGQEAIHQAEKLSKYYRTKGNSAILEVEQIRDQMRLAVDKVIGEGSLYDPNFASLALKQSEGDILEASFILRAFRSTLTRSTATLPIDTSKMEIILRSSATFKDIPGGQYLGPTKDFSQKFLDFELLNESKTHIDNFLKEYFPDQHTELKGEYPTFPKVVEQLRNDGLIEEKEESSNNYSHQVDDITRESLLFPSSRSMRLQALSRGETGAMLALAYSGVRGAGKFHPTIGELRVGYVQVQIPHPFYDGETITIGRVLVTEVEIVASLGEKKKGKTPKFSLGYGLTFGHNEVKAIAMAILDRSMKNVDPSVPSEDEEFVLSHIDGIESLGFISHFKLPHYVDFQAEMTRLKSIQLKEVEVNESI